MFQYHKAIFIQNSLCKISTRTLLETELLNLSNPEKSVVSAGKLIHHPHANNSNAEKIASVSALAETSLFV